MDKHTFHKLISMTTAWILACSSLAGTGMTAYADDRSTQQEQQSESSEPVPVIVQLSADALLDGNRTADQLLTPEAAACCETIRAEQDAVLAQLREWYPVPEPEYRYSTLTNAFSCMIPENLIDDAEALPEIQSVTRSYQVNLAKTEDPSAFSAAAYPFFEKTGCRGEGQVIAFIDTELDLRHPMFAPLPEDTAVKLTEEDVKTIAETVGFACKFDPKNVYHNSKVPFAANYLDYRSDDVSDSSEAAYHGSHVAGIAAGNVFQDEEGQTFSGVAPDAQIVFCALNVFSMENDDLIALLEDTVKLQADVVNISIGNNCELLSEDDAFRDAVNAAESAGVTVCISAGNEASGMGFNERPDAENPDVSQMNNMTREGTRALSVASADNPVDMESNALLFQDQKIAYSGYVNTAVDTQQLFSDTLKEPEYEYVYCGLGYPEDFEGKDLTGKLALIDRGILTFSEKAENAAAAGAVGVIAVQNDSMKTLIVPFCDASIPLGIISMEDGELLKQAAEKKIGITDEKTTQHLDAEVSFYTSYGVHNSLELRPDIMGVGGYVESAAYNSSTAMMSGTSMAAPYLAGCAALLNEYLDKQGCTLTGSERTQYMRNLLMTSAVPYRADGMFVTPRRQGAGMVSLENAVGTKILLTGKEGESKLSLRDKLGDKFSFPVTLRNISDEPVSFSTARIELTTDNSNYNANRELYEIMGQQKLTCTADLSGLQQIGAGETRTENVTVELDPAQTAELKKIFRNGFFIEGYLLLEGAENHPDISIPLLGFSDDFYAMPVLGVYAGAYVSYGRGNAFPGSMSLSDFFFAYGDEIDEYETDEDGHYSSKSLNEFFGRHTGDWGFPDRIYVSPNGDGIADAPGIRIFAEHDCMIKGGGLYDTDGNCLTEPYVLTEINDRSLLSYMDCTLDHHPIYPVIDHLSEIPEGDYVYRLSYGMTEDQLENHPRTVEIPVTVEKTPPELQTEETERDGRRILKITAKDSALDSLMVFGIGEGKPVFPKGAAVPQSCGTEHMHAVLKILSDHSLIPGDFDYLETDPAMDTVSGPSAAFLLKDTVNGNNWYNQFDYSELYKATPDENGCFTLEYDITDTKAYHIAAIDRAYNIGFVDVPVASEHPKEIKPGIYRGKYGLYEFTEETLHYVPLAYPVKENTYYYTVDNLWTESSVTLDLNKEREPGFNPTGGLGVLTGSPEEGYHITHSVPEVKDPDQSDVLVLTDLKTTEGYLAISAYDAETRYIMPMFHELTGCWKFMNLKYTVSPDAVVTYDADCYTKMLDPLGHVTITLDMKTGIATLPDGSIRDLIAGTEYPLGDANCDGSTDVADAVLVARYLVEDKSAMLKSQGIFLADCNHNNTLDSSDLTLILKAIARMIELD